MNRASLIATLTLITAPLAAQAPTPPDSIVVTHGQITLQGKTLRYTTRAGLLPLLDNDTGGLMGRMFFVSYSLDQPAGVPPRPLTFVWNGGPGSNAGQVHVVGFGPKRVKTADTYPTWGPNTETELRDNPETWFGVSDLVFVDPPGTGFSRATTIEYRDILYSDRGDTEATAEFIRVFLNRFNAWNAPLFIAGESYGTTRAMGVSEALERRRTHLAGVVLISGGFNVGQRVPPELNAALQLTMYTATAHYHKRLPSDLQSLSRDEAVKRATEWARTTYAAALTRRDSLSADERTELLAQLKRFTGIEPRYFDQRTLTISKNELSDRLLEDKGLELGRYDSRMTIKSRGEKPWLPMIDPSLLPMIDLMQGTSRLFNSYVRDTLKYRNDLLYRGPFGEAFYPRPLARNPIGIGEDWMSQMWNRGAAGRGGGRGGEEGAPTAGTQPGAAGAGRGGRGNANSADAPEPPPLRRAMEINPKLRVMNMKGMYDGSCATMDEAVARAEPLLKSRVVNHCYAGGHMMYSDLVARREMQRDFEAFVRAALGR
jgi:carboxypeptidase C (cathepsin A)